MSITALMDTIGFARLRTGGGRDTKVYLATRPVSMRYGFDGLAAQIADVLQVDPYSGHVFIFRGSEVTI